MPLPTYDDDQDGIFRPQMAECKLEQTSWGYSCDRCGYGVTNNALRFGEPKCPLDRTNPSAR